MLDIASSVHGLTEALRTIGGNGAAQTDRLGAVSESVSALDAMTQQNAALVEQSAASAASLKAQAASLVGLMSIFRLSTEAVSEYPQGSYHRSATVRTGASHNPSSSSSRVQTDNDAPALSSEVA